MLNQNEGNNNSEANGDYDYPELDSNYTKSVKNALDDSNDFRIFSRSEDLFAGNTPTSVTKKEKKEKEENEPKQKELTKARKLFSEVIHSNAAGVKQFAFWKLFNKAPEKGAKYSIFRKNFKKEWETESLTKSTEAMLSLIDGSEREVDKLINDEKCRIRRVETVRIKHEPLKKGEFPLLWSILYDAKRKCIYVGVGRENYILIFSEQRFDKPIGFIETPADLEDVNCMALIGEDWLIAGTSSGQVLMWNLDTQRRLRFPKDMEWPKWLVKSLEVIRGGEIVISVSLYGEVRLFWELDKTLRSAPRWGVPYQLSKEGASSLYTSPKKKPKLMAMHCSCMLDNDLMVVGGLGLFEGPVEDINIFFDFVRIDAETKKSKWISANHLIKTGDPDLTHRGTVASILYYKELKCIIAGAYDGSIGVWSIEGILDQANEKNEIKLVKILYVDSSVRRLRKIGTDGVFLSVHDDGSIHEWRAVTPKRGHLIKGHSRSISGFKHSSIRDMVLSPNNLFCLSEDYKIDKLEIRQDWAITEEKGPKKEDPPVNQDPAVQKKIDPHKISLLNSKAKIFVKNQETNNLLTDKEFTIICKLPTSSHIDLERNTDEIVVDLFQMQPIEGSNPPETERVLIHTMTYENLNIISSEALEPSEHRWYNTKLTCELKTCNVLSDNLDNCFFSVRMVLKNANATEFPARAQPRPRHSSQPAGELSAKEEEKEKARRQAELKHVREARAKAGSFKFVPEEFKTRRDNPEHYKNWKRKNGPGVIFLDHLNSRNRIRGELSEFLVRYSYLDFDQNVYLKPHVDDYIRRVPRRIHNQPPRDAVIDRVRYTSNKELEADEKSFFKFTETTLADLKKNWNDLVAMGTASDTQGTKDRFVRLTEIVHRLILSVHLRMGERSYNKRERNAFQADFDSEIFEALKNQKGVKHPIIYLAKIKHGSCRHRALLFKALCDALGIPCRYVRGLVHFRGRPTVLNAWNVLYVNGKYYMVDTMNRSDMVECRKAANYVFVSGNPKLDLQMNFMKRARITGELLKYFRTKGTRICHPHWWQSNHHGRKLTKREQQLFVKTVNDSQGVTHKILLFKLDEDDAKQGWMARVPPILRSINFESVLKYVGLFHLDIPYEKKSSEKRYPRRAKCFIFENYEASLAELFLTKKNRFFHKKEPNVVRICIHLCMLFIGIADAMVYVHQNGIILGSGLDTEGGGLCLHNIVMEKDPVTKVYVNLKINCFFSQTLKQYTRFLEPGMTNHEKFTEGKKLDMLDFATNILEPLLKSVDKKYIQGELKIAPNTLKYEEFGKFKEEMEAIIKHCTFKHKSFKPAKEEFIQFLEKLNILDMKNQNNAEQSGNQEEEKVDEFAASEMAKYGEREKPERKHRNLRAQTKESSDHLHRARSEASTERTEARAERAEARAERAEAEAKSDNNIAKKREDKQKWREESKDNFEDMNLTDEDSDEENSYKTFP